MRKKEIPVNYFKAEFPSNSVNESFSRGICAAFLASLDPTVSDLCDIRTAVSEAVTNSIVHGYGDAYGVVYITGETFSDGRVVIRIKDKGCGIANVKEAMEPLFTTDKSGDRAGMGFAIMKAFSDRLKVTSRPGKGTTVTIIKNVGKNGR